jgi:hypothetical protein
VVVEEYFEGVYRLFPFPMGALATFSSPWTPDDDLLLKNAIEVYY